VTAVATLQLYAASSGRLVDTVTISPAGTVSYASGAGRDSLEAFRRECANRGVTLGDVEVLEALDGARLGDVEVLCPDVVDQVPNVLVDLREAGGVGHLGDGEQLKIYWTRGKGAAKVRWGTHGDFRRCVRHLGKYVTDPEGLCNTYHVAAVGAPPGKGHP
jgi:hypothetical protein